MLIENGKINWRLKPSASSRKLRNGVGITGDGKVVFMLSERETNFYDFACYAQSRLNVRQMLYLDGTISKMYQKGRQRAVAVPSVRHHDRGGEQVVGITSFAGSSSAPGSFQAAAVVSETT